MKLNPTSKWQTWVLLPPLVLFFWAMPIYSFNLNPLSSGAKANFFNKDLQKFEEIFEILVMF